MDRLFYETLLSLLIEPLYSKAAYASNCTRPGAKLPPHYHHLLAMAHKFMSIVRRTGDTTLDAHYEPTNSSSLSPKQLLGDAAPGHSTRYALAC